MVHTMEVVESTPHSQERSAPAAISSGTVPSQLAPGTNHREGRIIEPATDPDGKPLPVIFWETISGRILGPATPEFFLRDGSECWISLTFEGCIRFIRDDRLRSRKAFERQSDVLEFDPIR